MTNWGALQAMKQSGVDLNQRWKAQGTIGVRVRSATGPAEDGTPSDVALVFNKSEQNWRVYQNGKRVGPKHSDPTPAIATYFMLGGKREEGEKQ